MNFRSVLLGLSLVMTFVVSFAMAHNVFAAGVENITWEQYEKKLAARNKTTRSGVAPDQKAAVKNAAKKPVNRPATKTRTAKASANYSPTPRLYGSKKIQKAAAEPAIIYSPRPRLYGKKRTPKAPAKPSVIYSPRPQLYGKKPAKNPTTRLTPSQNPHPPRVVTSPAVKGKSGSTSGNSSPQTSKGGSKNQASGGSTSGGTGWTNMKRTGGFVGGGNSSQPSQGAVHDHSDHEHNFDTGDDDAPSQSSPSPHPRPQSSTPEDTTILMPLCGCTDSSCRETSPYKKNRLNPVTGKVSDHRGLDIGAPIGQDVRALGAGVVTKVGFQAKGAGNYIVVYHPGALSNNQGRIKSERGYKTKYMHLSKTYVSKGNPVEKGDIIGAVGNTGGTTGSHLHVELLVDGLHVNPIEYFEIGSVPPLGGDGSTMRSCPAKYKNMKQTYKDQATRR